MVICRAEGICPWSKVRPRRWSLEDWPPLIWCRALPILGESAGWCAHFYSFLFDYVSPAVLYPTLITDNFSPPSGWLWRLPPRSWLSSCMARGSSMPRSSGLKESFRQGGQTATLLAFRYINHPSYHQSFPFVVTFKISSGLFIYISTHLWVRHQLIDMDIQTIFGIKKKCSPKLCAKYCLP